WPVSLATRVVRWCLHNRAAAAGLVVGTALVLAACGYREISRNRQQAEAQRDAAVQQEQAAMLARLQAAANREFDLVQVQQAAKDRAAAIGERDEARKQAAEQSRARQAAVRSGQEQTRARAAAEDRARD